MQGDSRLQALEADAAGRLWNEFFFSAPQLNAVGWVQQAL